MPTTPAIPRIKPPALQPGDTIGIVAPASNIKRELLDAGCEALRRNSDTSLSISTPSLEKDLYFAGSADRRARELEEMFTRDDVRAIVCARGGYGANYLLDTLNLDKIKAHPKIFVGYSDITSAADLHFGLHRPRDLPRSHGHKGFRPFRRRRSAHVGSRAQRSFRVEHRLRTGIGSEASSSRFGRRNSLWRLSVDAGSFVGHAL